MRALTRRAALTSFGSGIAVWHGRPRSGSTSAAPAFNDDFSTSPPGSLHGRRSVSGHVWTVRGADNGPGFDPSLVVADGTIGAPPGFATRTPLSGDPNPVATAGYASVDLTRPARRVGAEFRFTPSESAVGGLALGAFDYQYRPTGPDQPPGVGGSSMHLTVSPTMAVFAVFSHGAGDFTELSPVDGAYPGVLFPVPLTRDSRVVHRAEIVLSDDTAVVLLPNTGTLMFRDRRICTVAARYPFFEYYAAAGTGNRPRLTRVWAE